MPYVEVDELASWLAIGDGLDDPHLARAVAAAQADVDSYCGWGSNAFDQGAATATARVFFSTDTRTFRLPIGSGFWTATDLVVKVDTGDNGTYDETWLASDYVLAPLNQTWAGQSSFPYFEVHAVDTKRFPIDYRTIVPVAAVRPRIQITAKWGWQSVPEPVAQAALMRAAQIHQRRRSADGTNPITGFRAGGRDRDWELLLDDFRHPGKRQAFA